MDQTASDMVMKFTLMSGGDVPAEGVIEIDKDDKLMEGFSPAAYRDYSNYFEITDFEFSLKVNEKDEDIGGLSKPAMASRDGGNGRMPRVAAGPFSRWRSATDNEYTKIRYPVEFDKFTFTRLIDSASPVFFQACCNSETFASAVLVKRVSRGDAGKERRIAWGYLRFRFEKVLIIGVDWDDGEVVKETCTFICQKLEITYKQQRMSGGLGSGMDVTWDQKSNQANTGAGGS